jgi:isoleucyl-tRNA synthetase
LEDASDILVKQIKPNFKTLGPRFGKDMKAIANAVMNFTSEDINKIEQTGGLEVDINGKKITLGLEDVEITSQDIEGWLVANEGSLTVALDVTISDDLRKEGIARELVNRIQNLRKDSGFEVTDRIDVLLQKDDKIVNAVNNNITYIKAETLTEELDIIERIDNGIEIAFDDVNTKLSIKKH